MCFTPFVSGSVAALEWIFATLILLRFRKSKVTPYVISLLYLLGAYQFTELMLCVTGNAELWVRVGFVAYSFLPVIGVHFVLVMVDSAWQRFAKFLYAIPVAFSAAAMLSPNFVEEGVCNSIFVTARTMFFQPRENPLVAMMYGGYYYLFILISVVIVLFSYPKERNRMKRIYYAMGIFGLSLITISPFIFIILLPAYGLRLPSIFCEFALAFAIIAFIASYLDHKHRIFANAGVHRKGLIIH